MFARLTCYHSLSPRYHGAIRGCYHCNISPITGYQSAITLLSTVIKILRCFCINHGLARGCDVGQGAKSVIIIHPAAADSVEALLVGSACRVVPRRAIRAASQRSGSHLAGGIAAITSLAQAVGERGNVGNNGGFRLLPAATSFHTTADFAEFLTRLATDH
jgi:hypothetical protein